MPDHERTIQHPPTSERERVIQHITRGMVAAYTRADMQDAQNMNAYLATLEGMSNAAYQMLVDEAPEGAIS